MLTSSNSQSQNKDKSNLYKRRYHIAFYGIDDESYIAGFDNVTDICRYKGLALNKTNLDLLRSELCHALQRDGNSTRMLNGKAMRVYLIDMEDDECLE